MTVSQIVSFLLEKYPLEWQEPWDYSGLSVKTKLNSSLKGVVVAIDLNSQVVQKAIELQANLIVVHHPFKFAKLWSDDFELAPYKIKILSKLRRYGISVLSLHTNYDNSSQSTSFQIARYLDLQNYVLKYQQNYPCLISTSLSVNEIIDALSKKLNLHSFRTNAGNYTQKYSKIAFLAGSGSSSLARQLSEEGIELIITSDIKWSDWIMFQEHNVKILEIPHLVEQVFVGDISEQLQTKFKNIKINAVYLEQPYRNI